MKPGCPGRAEGVCPGTLLEAGAVSEDGLGVVHLHRGLELNPRQSGAAVSFAKLPELCLGDRWGAVGLETASGLERCCCVGPDTKNHRITESQNSRGWKGPLWVI